MANLIPWDEFEEEYAKNFAGDIGASALPFPMALGSLIIKEKLGISDRETVEQIKENPHLQHFIGQKYYSNDVGVSKRRFSLNRVMAKLPDTCQTAIAITFLVTNLSALLRQFFAFLCFQQTYTFFPSQLLIQAMIGGIVNNKGS